jgi:hypothetical protein
MRRPVAGGIGYRSARQTDLASSLSALMRVSAGAVSPSALQSWRCATPPRTIYGVGCRGCRWCGMRGAGAAVRATPSIHPECPRGTGGSATTQRYRDPRQPDLGAGIVACPQQRPPYLDWPRSCRARACKVAAEPPAPNKQRVRHDEFHTVNLLPLRAKEQAPRVLAL